MTTTRNRPSKQPATKMPVAGKSGKDGITADLRSPNFRVQDRPPVRVPGQFQPR
jgi:hypothetical protein